MEPVVVHLLAWAALPVAAVGNGLVREATYGKRMASTVAHSVAVVPLVAIVLAWACVLAWWVPLDAARAWLVGAGWFVLTVAFEFGFGALRGQSMRELLAQWDVRRGHLWPFVPCAALIAPRLALGWVG